MSSGLNRLANFYLFHLLASVLIIATLLLMWFGYRAASEWQRSTSLLVQQGAAESVMLLATALSRDMRGAQSEVLPQLQPVNFQSKPVYERIVGISGGCGCE